MKKPDLPPFDPGSPAPTMRFINGRFLEVQKLPGRRGEVRRDPELAARAVDAWHREYGDRLLAGDEPMAAA
jgi:hypothetical protein